MPAAVQQPTTPATPVQPTATQQPAAGCLKPPVAPKAPAEPVHKEKAEPAREPVAKIVRAGPETQARSQARGRESGEVLDAREALKGLDQGPVVKVKKKSEEEDFTDRALQDAINRPPAPPSDEPVLKVKREPSNDEPPPPAP